MVWGGGVHGSTCICICVCGGGGGGECMGVHVYVCVGGGGECTGVHVYVCVGGGGGVHSSTCITVLSLI